MKIALFQFSGTGNTYLVARYLKDAFLVHNASCTVYSLEALKDGNSAILEADIVGLGYPIYGSSFPKPVEMFIKTLERHHKRAFVYCTQMMYSGDGAAIGAKALRKKGFSVHQLAHFNMPNNITDFRLLHWVKPKDSEKLAKKLASKTERFAKAIVADTRIRKGENVLSLALGLIQRIPFKKGREMYKKALRVDKDCILCQRCVALCPSQNLRIEDNQLQIDSLCYLCYRCVNHCPVQAIHFSRRAKVIRPYLGPSTDFTIEDVRKHH